MAPELFKEFIKLVDSARRTKSNYISLLAQRAVLEQKTDGEIIDEIHRLEERNKKF